MQSCHIDGRQRRAAGNPVWDDYGKKRRFAYHTKVFQQYLCLVRVWQSTGWGTIIYLAALAGVSPELIESAKIDGAGRLQIIRHVNLPCILPTIIIMFIMSTGSILTVGFEKIFLLQNDLNLETSRVISTYTYEIGLLGGQFSYSTAIGLFNNVINVIMLFLSNKIAKKVSGIGLW